MMSVPRETYAAAAGTVNTDHAVEKGRLSRSVRAYHAEDFALLEFKAHQFHCRKGTKGLGNPVTLQNGGLMD